MKTIFKKLFIASCICTLFVANIFAAQKPYAILQAQAPQKTFPKLQTALKQIYPEPQMEMMAAMMLAPIGYPFFDEVSPKENIAVMVFANGDANPLPIVAIKATEEAAITKFLKLQKLKYITKDGWILFALDEKAPDISRFADDAITAARRPISTDISLVFYSQALKNLPFDAADKEAKEAIESFSKEVEATHLNLSFDGDSTTFELRFDAVSSSIFAQYINTIPLKGKITESAFIQQNADVAIFGRINQKSNDFLLKEFPFLEKIVASCAMKINGKIKGTFALSIKDILSKKPDATYVGMIDMSFDEYKNSIGKSMEFNLAKDSDIAKSVPMIGAYMDSIGDIDIKIKFDDIKIGDIDAIAQETSTYIKNEKVDSQISYIAIFNKYLINSQTKEGIATTIEKIKNPPANFDFKKFETAKGDLIIAINNKEVFKDYPNIDNIKEPYTTITLTALRNAMSISADVDYTIIQNAIAIYLMALQAQQVQMQQTQQLPIPQAN